MLAFRIWRWSVLALVCGLTAPAARAEMITPNSIPNPPGAVGSANGTLVDANSLVSTQYDGLGLRFLTAVAITQLNNISVWAPINRGSQNTISYTFYGVGGLLVRPGSLTPTTASSVTMDVIGITGTPDVVANSFYGYLPIVPVLQSTPGPDGGQLWTLTGPGIASFGIGPSASQTGAWGVAGVFFTPSPAPEPSSLVLACLGLPSLGLAGWFRRPRRRKVVATVTSEA